MIVDETEVEKLAPATGSLRQTKSKVLTPQRWMSQQFIGHQDPDHSWAACHFFVLISVHYSWVFDGYFESNMTGRYVLPTQLRGVSSIYTFRASTAPLSLSGRFSAACPRNQTSSASTAKAEDKQTKDENENEEQDSAMTRRLAQMTEDAMLEGGRSAHRNIEHAGFSEELKKQLEERVAAASFKSEYAAAHSIVNMPVSNPPNLQPTTH
jgi:hypothetical protein